MRSLAFSDLLAVIVTFDFTLGFLSTTLTSFYEFLGPAVTLLLGKVLHAFRRARNSVSCMVSEHCKINVVMALKVRSCTCPVERTRE